LPGFDLGIPPRAGGLTHVLDKGLGPRGWEDLLETCGGLIDVIKLGWGTSYVTANLRRKLDVLRDKSVVLGGTFFELVYARDKLEEYKRWLRELGLTHVEISDGTVEIPRERKLELVADFAREFTVLSEVGSKDSAVEFTPDEWTRWLREELDAGAWKVIFEAPTKSSQVWFIKHFGPEVNLGNIPPDEVIPLETLRLGLRGDTLKQMSAEKGAGV